ncbi:MAG TPA: anhydro-N-acetylmuramic acid kinase [Ignavibacteria bacterium]|nr:anhydro-N-acetylmuramic acid kinase [Ignavibacteria bacterium]HMR39290.1 anhydro-N-acetylmuramic acid kinase [Ignavibacteria bacterium]
MKKFVNLVNKTGRVVIGVLSGTSVDGVDVVLLKISGKSSDSKIKVIDFKTYPVRAELKKFILKCSSENSVNAEDICRLNFMIGNLFADSVLKIIKKNKLQTKDIDLIGSHGQTIFHYPFNNKLFSLSSKSTLQIGDISVISNKTGITTVGDFRTGDVAVNGDGAPLVPYLDHILFSDSKKDKVLINIGGISNLTLLKKSCRQNDVIAFDCGPGNILIDYLANKYFKKKFDRNGSIASKGKVDEKLFEAICKSDKFFKKSPPKSTGREYYSAEFINNILNKFKRTDPKDILATFTKFTAYAVYINLKKYKAEELIISGGGAKNSLLMKFINEYFKDTIVRKIDDNGINCDNKEAVLFAVLANELMNGIKTNMPSVTGSERNAYLGKISIA